ncbi:MAG: hypothetical protein KBF88_11000 [Polyangiaceae bacterium]|nr:hypothetical protein [Polyangiaceae bacterium]
MKSNSTSQEPRRRKSRGVVMVEYSLLLFVAMGTVSGVTVAGMSMAKSYETAHKYMMAPTP